MATGLGSKVRDWPTPGELLREDLEGDPEFRALWERHAVARAVALRIVSYRSDNDLSQTALARKLGMKQPAIARLELGEVNPSIETLKRLSEGLGIEFLIDIAPTTRRKLVTAETRKRAVRQEMTNGERASVLVAMT